jgi:menaquinone-dependent protoporphyrinogen oxidase
MARIDDERGVVGGGRSTLGGRSVSAVGRPDRRTTFAPRSRAVRPCPEPRHGRQVGAMDDSVRVLVGYASAAGSTAGVAERVADVLRAAGCAVVCRPADGDGDGDVAGFDAAVLGSAVHNGAWLPPAVGLARRVAGSGSRPVWCFSVGGLDPRGRLGTFMAAREAQAIERGFPAALAVRDHRVFGGVVRPAEVPLWGRVFYRLTGTRAGDHRDWSAIEAWAAGVAAELAGPGKATRDVTPSVDPPRKPT